LGCAFSSSPKTLSNIAISSTSNSCFSVPLAWGVSAIGLQQIVLWSSACGDDAEALEISLACGASAQSSGSRGTGWTILHCACQHARKGRSFGRTVRVLIDAGADASAKDVSGRAPIHIAAGVGAAGALDALLNHARVFAECSDGQGRTAMHWAAMCGSVECMQLLLDARCECDLRDLRGMTPLHYAARLGSAPACAFLIRNGASLETEDQWSQTALKIAQRHHFRKDYRNHALFDVLENKCTMEQLENIIHDKLSVEDRKDAPVNAQTTLFSAWSSWWARITSAFFSHNEDPVAKTV